MRIRRSVAGLIAVVLVVGMLASCEIPDPDLAATPSQTVPTSTPPGAADIDREDHTCSFTDRTDPLAPVEVTTSLQVFEPDPNPGDPHYIAPPSYVAPGKRPAILWVHGGGWFGGPPPAEEFDLPVIRALLLEGWVVVSTTYRFAPAHPFPAQIIDVKGAVNCVKRLTGQPGITSVIETGRVVVAGGSAGGHLATLAALTAGTWEPGPGSGSLDGDPLVAAEGTTVRSVMNFDGPNDLTAMWGTAGIVHDLIANLFCAPADTGPACATKVESWIGVGTAPPSGPSASPADWVPSVPTTAPSPRLYLACGDTPGLGPTFTDCADHRAMYQKLLAAHPGPDTVETTAAHRVWYDDTSYPCGGPDPCVCQPGDHEVMVGEDGRCGTDHFSTMLSRINFAYLKVFLQL